MKSQEKQRHNRRVKEELSERKDACGFNDPTLSKAVREIIKEFKKHNDK